MKFINIKKLRVITLTLGTGSFIAGGVSLPFLFKKIENKEQEIKTKKVKEIINEDPVEESELVKSINRKTLLLNEISTDETKWAEFKGILLKKMDFNKQQISNSNTNRDKLNFSYKVDQFNKINDVFYIIDKFELKDGSIKIFGYIKQGYLEIKTVPIIVKNFLTTLQQTLLKLNSLDSTWVLENFSIGTKLEEYTLIRKEEVKNSLRISLQNNYIKVDIENLLIDKLKGEVSFEAIFSYGGNTNVVPIKFQDLEKDTPTEIKKIDSLYLEKNIFNFQSEPNRINALDVNWKDFKDKIKNIKVIQNKDWNIDFINDKDINEDGGYKFDVKFSKKGYKSYSIAMYYSNFFKKGNKLFEDLGSTIKKENDIKILEEIKIENWVKLKEKEVDEYFISNSKGWTYEKEIYTTPFPHGIEIKITLKKAEYQDLIIKIKYKVSDYKFLQSPVYVFIVLYFAFA